MTPPWRHPTLGNGGPIHEHTYTRRQPGHADLGHFAPAGGIKLAKVQPRANRKPVPQAHWGAPRFPDRVPLRDY